MITKLKSHSLRLAAFGLLAVLLAGSTPGSALAAEVSIVKIKATGTPSGAPELDEAVADLPAIAGLCRMYAKCTHEGTTRRKVAFGKEVAVGSGATRIAVVAGEPGDDGRLPVKVSIGTKDAPCLSNTSSVKPGAPLVRFCERLLDDGTYIFVVTVSL